MQRILHTRRGIAAATLAVSALAILLAALTVGSCSSTRQGWHALGVLARVASGQTPAWSMFGGVDGSGKRRSGHTGPSRGRVAWSYAADNNVSSSAVIAGDGTVYFTTGYGKLYALTPNGTQKWTYAFGTV